jgi:hypothetical protein
MKSGISVGPSLDKEKAEKTEQLKMALFKC